MGQLRNMKRNRALDAAARFLRTLPSQVLLQPRVGRSAYERAKRCKFPIILSDRRDQSGRRASGRSANQIAARGPGLVHAATALGAECPQPPGDCRHDHVRRPVPRTSWPGRARGCVARLPVRDADPTHRRERHGWRRFVGNCPRARCREARCRRRACPAHVCSGPWPCGGVLDRAAARRTVRLSMDGGGMAKYCRPHLPTRTWRSAAQHPSACSICSAVPCEEPAIWVCPPASSSAA